MPAAAKKKPRPEPAPVAPHVYPGLFEAYEFYKQAETEWKGVLAGIDDARGLIIETDKIIEELSGKVEAADLEDDRRSASMILARKSAPVQWVGESARHRLTHAQKRRESLVRGKAELQSEAKRKELITKIRWEAVVNEVVKIKEPIVAKKAERVVALQAELTGELAGLNVLIDDPLPNLGDEVVAQHQADKARRLAWGETREKALAAMCVNADRKFDLEKATALRWKEKLSVSALLAGSTVER